MCLTALYDDSQPTLAVLRPLLQIKRVNTKRRGSITRLLTVLERGADISRLQASADEFVRLWNASRPKPAPTPIDFITKPTRKVLVPSERRGECKTNHVSTTTRLMARIVLLRCSDCAHGGRRCPSIEPYSIAISSAPCRRAAAAFGWPWNRLRITCRRPHTNTACTQVTRLETLCAQRQRW